MQTWPLLIYQQKDGWDIGLGVFFEVFGVFYEQLFCQKFGFIIEKLVCCLLFGFFPFFKNYYSKGLRSSLTRKMPQWAAALSLHPVLSVLYCFPPALDLNLHCRNGSLSRWLLVLSSSILIFLVLQKWLYGFFSY